MSSAASGRAPRAAPHQNVTVAFHGRRYPAAVGTTLLDCLLQAGVDLPHSCRKGSCLTCVVTCLEGGVPETARHGLRPVQRERGGFLACQHRLDADITIGLLDDPALQTEAEVVAKDILAPDVCALSLRTQSPFDYRAGQFVNLLRDDGLTRSYSLASLPGDDQALEVHVKRLPGGALSGWLFDRVEPGALLRLDGPYGECHYRGDDPTQPLLLIGSGTGLAPLIGVLREALRCGHRGEIRLYHGSRYAGGLYRDEALRALQASQVGFRYVPCVSGEAVPDGFRAQRADRAAFDDLPDLTGWRVYLCGYPAMVEAAKRSAFLSGAALEEIHADPFSLRERRAAPRPGLPRADTW